MLPIIFTHIIFIDIPISEWFIMAMPPLVPTVQYWKFAMPGRPHIDGGMPACHSYKLSYVKNEMPGDTTHWSQRVWIDEIHWPTLL